MKKEKKGLIIVNTGIGKGKTTAALGILMRACGHGQKACVIQFIKSETGRWGEVKTAEKLGIEWHKTGSGFSMSPKGDQEAAAKARQGWKLAQEKIVSGQYDLILLDEFTYLLHNDWLDTAEVITWLKENKPANLHIIITGRSAPSALVKFADLVTEMLKIKHPFDQGIKGQRGIEF
ncbi:MAG: cob(I)yrinic acid a,c-diamide adenosyltransferase [Chloroflexota bacterium]|nr:cob(I)yrinic acid a,c-diamide adenosyltransferase [Chloroflexota bacterium]